MSMLVFTLIDAKIDNQWELKFGVEIENQDEEK